ncbi:MAG: protein-glutamate O-methyltransferase CheR [Alphaproteobacteria bacterium]|nr:protein-glutamate O-methyltransferase CheR [Alphaproteobacteria bacterium]
MTPADFDFMAQMLKRRSGLVLTPEKAYLIESRIAPLVRRHGLANFEAVVLKLREGDERVARDVTEAMTTNESFFFRDKTPFDHFEKLMLPKLLQSRAGQKRLRIWCAAASTGQEPYSLAMLIKERWLQLKEWKVEIFGTDLSSEVLERAKAGLYSQFEVQRGLPVQLLVKYFIKEGEQFRLKDDIRSMVHYKVANLLDGYSGFGVFDVIFCRNVLIYFDAATKRGVLDRMAKLLPDDGYLLLGAAESVVGLSSSFAPHESARGVSLKAGAMTAASPMSKAVGA